MHATYPAHLFHSIAIIAHSVKSTRFEADIKTITQFHDTAAAISLNRASYSQDSASGDNRTRRTR